MKSLFLVFISLIAFSGCKNDADRNETSIPQDIFVFRRAFSAGLSNYLEANHNFPEGWKKLKFPNSEILNWMGLEGDVDLENILVKYGAVSNNMHWENVRLWIDSDKDQMLSNIKFQFDHNEIAYGPPSFWIIMKVEGDVLVVADLDGGVKLFQGSQFIAYLEYVKSASEATEVEFPHDQLKLLEVLLR